VPRFETKGEELYIDGKKVLKGWEDRRLGWYWFGIDGSKKQDTVIEGKIYKSDKIWYGLEQSFIDEWGYFSQAEIEYLKPGIREIKKKDLPNAGNRERFRACKKR